VNNFTPPQGTREDLDPDATLLLAVIPWPIRIAHRHNQKEFPEIIAVTPVFSVDGV